MISITDIYEDYKELVRWFLVKRINEEFSDKVEYVIVRKPDGIETISKQEADLETRTEVVLNEYLIPWLIRKGNNVYITTGIIHELGEAIGDIGGLKSLAELLGWEYIPKMPAKIGDKTTSYRVIKVSLSDFINFLALREI